MYKTYLLPTRRMVSNTAVSMNLNNTLSRLQAIKQVNDPNVYVKGKERASAISNAW